MKTMPITTEKEVHPLPSFQVRGGNPYEKTIRQFKEKRDELNRRFLNHKSSDNPEGLSDILDDYFRNSFGRSESGFKLDLISNPYAIIATGSYGRKEVARKPDVSILFIFKDSVPEDAVGLIRDIVYPLWDLGLTVNHSTKTVKDCITTATKDFSTLSSLIDSRFICGVSPLYSRLMNQLREKIVFNRKKDILFYLVDKDHTRHLKYSSPECLLEPDLVFSPGGLKDYHAIMSAARIALGMIEPREIEYEGLVSADEYRMLNESLDFIRYVLRFIHLSEDKAQSRLLLKHQHKAARFMNYENDHGRNAVDLFLSDVFHHMDRIRMIRDRFFLGLVPELTVPASSLENDVKTTTKWVNISKGMITLTSSVKLKKHPELLLAAFAESVTNGAPLSPETLRLIHEFLFLADSAFLSNKAMTGLFEDLLFLSPSISDIPERMFETGTLSVFIPAFEKLKNHKTFGVHPSYPLCRHHLLTLNHLKILLENHGTKVPVLSDTVRRSLLWAGLLHDIGTVTTSKHHEKTGAAEIITILDRFHSDETLVRSVLFLVENHHLMERFVTDEDLTNRTAIAGFINTLENSEQLTLLYYLSLANLRARGDSTVTDFIETDLSMVYDIGMGLCTGCSPSSTTVPDAYAPDSLEKIKAMGNREKEAPYLHVLEHKNTRTATLAYPLGPESLPGVLSAFLVHNMDIYDLRVIEDTDQTYLVLRVTPPKDRMFEKQKWAELEKTLDGFFAGRPSLDADVRESVVEHELDVFNNTKIKIYNPDVSASTRIDIQGKNSSLLFYRITRTLASRGYRILFMRKGSHRIGSRFLFSIQDSNGNRLAPNEKCQLKAVLDHECNG